MWDKKDVANYLVSPSKVGDVRCVRATGQTGLSQFKFVQTCFFEVIDQVIERL